MSLFRVKQLPEPCKLIQFREAIIGEEGRIIARRFLQWDSPVTISRQRGVKISAVLDSIRHDQLNRMSQIDALMRRAA